MTSSGLVVLIVEDNALTRMDLAEAFEASGWIVLEAGSGQAALNLCDSDLQVDALVTDIDLGSGTTGWDVARAFWGRNTLPVIYVSGNSDAPHRHVPQSRFVAKPCPPSMLIEACVHLHARFREENSKTLG
jgi:CheY-like chemotaxis protein